MTSKFIPPKGPRPDESAGASRDRDVRTGWGDHLIAILNGTVGDYLARRGNGLATEMALYHANEPVHLDRSAVAGVHPKPTSRICLFVHGLGCTEGVWSFTGEPAVTYGSLLQAKLGYTPFYVRYNTGLHISQNGALLSSLIEALLLNYPGPVDEIVVLGWSMGGLVFRSACHEATLAGRTWVDLVRHAIYLGVPHRGAPLPKATHALEQVLRAVPSVWTEQVAGFLGLRSSGIRDLRTGKLVNEDQERGERALFGELPREVPLRSSIAHHLVVGTLSSDEKGLVSRLFGDGVVRSASAAGLSAPEERDSGSPPVALKIFPGINHFQLPHHPAIYEQIEKWCAKEES